MRQRRRGPGGGRRKVLMYENLRFNEKFEAAFKNVDEDFEEEEEKFRCTRNYCFMKN